MNVVMQLQHQQPLKFFSRPHFQWWTVAGNGENQLFQVSDGGGSGYGRPGGGTQRE